MGRELALTEVAGPLVHARFEDLCGRPLGAADFIALAQAKHTLLLRGVPVFTGASRSQAYRFVTLIDVLYEHRTRLLCSAEATPSDLFANVVTVAAAAEARRKGRPPGPEQASGRRECGCCCVCVSGEGWGARNDGGDLASVCECSRAMPSARSPVEA